MSRLFYGTNLVSEDEDCLNLTEDNRMAPDSKGFHRYQIIVVNRGGNPAEIMLDMGLTNTYSCDPFTIPGGWHQNGRYYVEYTVGELRDCADWLRTHNIFDKWDRVKFNPGQAITVSERRYVYA